MSAINTYIRWTGQGPSLAENDHGQGVLAGELQQLRSLFRALLADLVSL